MAGAKPAKKAIIQLDVTGSGVLVPIGEVRDFEINTALGTIDASTLSTKWKKFLVGQAGWTASMKMFYDPSDEGQEELVARALNGELCSFTFLPFGEDEVYLLNLGEATGGTFKLGNGASVVTDALPYNVTALTMQTELRAAYDEQGIFVVEDDDGFWISFPTGVKANLQIMNNTLTGGTTATCALQPVPAKYTGEGNITGWNPAGATEDAVGVSLAVQGTGELVKVI